MSSLRYEQARLAQKCKVDVNRALDQAAGHTLTLDERAEWWVTNERFLRMHDEHEYHALMTEAKAYPA